MRNVFLFMFYQPSRANEAAFQVAVDDIVGITARLLDSLETLVAPKNGQEEATKAKAHCSKVHVERSSEVYSYR